VVVVPLAVDVLKEAEDAVGMSKKDHLPNSSLVQDWAKWSRTEKFPQLKKFLQLI
jgi:hypothetical protein